MNLEKHSDGLSSRLRRTYVTGGIWLIISSAARKLANLFVNVVMCTYYSLFKEWHFKVEGKIYNYFLSVRSGMSYSSERTIEIPFMLAILDGYAGRRVLEVGNVLSAYLPIRHDILDKYEVASGVINEDVVDFKTDKKYDLILSISTMEHVGWDFGEEKDPSKVLKAFENLKNCLRTGGELVFSVPIGSNLNLDEMLLDGRLQLKKIICMKRVSSDNRWVQVESDELRGIKYGEPYPYANGLVFGFM